MLVPWLKQNAPAIAVFREGAKKEDCRLRLLKDPAYPVWPRSSLSFIRVREMTQLIVFNGKYLEHQNKHREALDLYLAMAKMGYHISLDSPSLVEGMVGVLANSLSAGAIRSCILSNRFDTPTLTYLRERLNVLGSAVQNYHTAMSAENASVMAALEHRFECRREVLVSSREEAQVLLMDLGPSLGFRPFWRSDTMAALRRSWDAVDKWNELPDHRAYAQGEKLLEEAEEEQRFWSLAFDLLASYRMSRSVVSTAKTTKAVIPTVIALEIYRNKSSDYPEGLDELKGILDEIPNDPFTNEPLKYRRTENGYIVYSVCQNLVDDGGKGDDIVARRPLPEPNPFKPE